MACVLSADLMLSDWESWVAGLSPRSEGGDPGVNLTFCCFEVYSTRRFVLRFAWCCFVLVLLFYFVFVLFCVCPLITSLGEERAVLSAFRAFVRFTLVWFCLFPLQLGVWEGLRFVIVALPGLFSSLFFQTNSNISYPKCPGLGM